MDDARYVQNWLAHARFSPEVGSGIAQSAAEFSRQWDQMDDRARTVHNRTTEARLRERYQGDYESNLSLAQQLLQEVNAQQPGLIDYINATGAGSDPLFISHVIEQARRLNARPRT